MKRPIISKTEQMIFAGIFTIFLGKLGCDAYNHITYPQKTFEVYNAARAEPIEFKYNGKRAFVIEDGDKVSFHYNMTLDENLKTEIGEPSVRWTVLDDIGKDLIYSDDFYGARLTSDGTAYGAVRKETLRQFEDNEISLKLAQKEHQKLIKKAYKSVKKSR